MFSVRNLVNIIKELSLFGFYNLYGYTDHSYRHAIRVCNNVVNLLLMFVQMPQFISSMPRDFLERRNIEELLASALLHDIGNLIGRNLHHMHTRDILSDNDFLSWQTSTLCSRTGLPYNYLHDIALICYAHRHARGTRNPDFFTNIYSDAQYVSSPSIALDAAILLIADALDISSIKTPSSVNDILSVYSRRYPETHGYGNVFWEQHREILGLYFSQNQIKIYASDLSNVDRVIQELEDDFNYAKNIFQRYQLNFGVSIIDIIGNSRDIYL